LVPVRVDDPAAMVLAERIGGRPSVRIEKEPAEREFDVVSNLYVGPVNPRGMKLASDSGN
jgi:hypothetical protein